MCPFKLDEKESLFKRHDISKRRYNIFHKLVRRKREPHAYNSLGNVNTYRVHIEKQEEVIEWNKI